jgi:hypothetical protein
MWAASGKDFSLSMATTPRAGPRAKNAKAQRHPKASSKKGMSQMVGTVRAKELASRRLAILPQRQPYFYGYRRQAFQAHVEE